MTGAPRYIPKLSAITEISILKTSDLTLEVLKKIC